MEVLAGVVGTDAEMPVRAFLSGFRIREITHEIAEQAGRCRNDLGMRLPDAISLATARTEKALLVTRNTRDFDPSWPEVREPYRL